MFGTNKNRLLPVIVIVFSTLLTSVAMADDWVATKLRGGVFAFDGAGWVKVERGTVISDNRVIRTLLSGRVAFTRDGETIEMGGGTQISIRDKSGRRFTTVDEHYGLVTIEAEVENVQHFAVKTPYLAAVVKGTKFSVRVRDGKAKVEVSRGRVEVEDLERGLKVNVVPGQSASAGDTPLEISGSGQLDTIVTLDGKPAVVPTVESPGHSGSVSGQSANRAGGGGGVVGSTVSRVGGTASNVVGGASSAVGSVARGGGSVASAGRSAVSGATGAASSAVETVTETVTETVDSAGSAVSEVVSGVGGALGGLL